MKALAIFMSIFMIIISLSPCQDKDAMNSGILLKVNNHSKENPDRDVCSPFCHCARCPFSIVIPQAQPLSISYQFLNDILKPTANAGIQTHIAPSVWQPPKAV